MDKNVVIEIATGADCEELAKLKLKIWNTTYCEIYPKEKFVNYNYDEQKSKFEKCINDKNGVFYIARDVVKKQIVGYCYAGFSQRAYKSGVPEIILLYIAKEYQGHGIGRSLFEKCKEYFNKIGIAHFVVSCNKYNYPAQAFYKKMGGEIVCIDDDNPDKSLPQVKFWYEI